MCSSGRGGAQNQNKRHAVAELNLKVCGVLFVYVCVSSQNT